MFLSHVIAHAQKKTIYPCRHDSNKLQVTESLSWRIDKFGNMMTEEDAIKRLSSILGDPLNSSTI